MRWMWLAIALLGVDAEATNVDKPRPERCELGGRWVGTGHQFDIDEHWTIDLTIDLSETRLGARVGEVSYPSLSCSGGLFRLHGQAVTERIERDPGRACLDGGSIRFTCRGGALEYRYYYPDGRYAAFAKLRRP